MTLTEWLLIFAIAAIIGIAYMKSSNDAEYKDSCLSNGGKYVTEVVGSYPVLVNKVVIMQRKYKRECVYE